MSLQNTSSREKWGSKIGFILSAAGAAVGLGNIQRFPYLVAQEGGGAFVLLYLACVFLLGIPMIILEFSLGRNSRLNPYNAIKKNHPHSLYRFGGLLGIGCSFFILCYYIVATGWTAATISNVLRSKNMLFMEMSQTPRVYWPFVLLSLFITYLVVSRGIQKGIERICKILMPILVLLITAFVIYGLSLPDSMKGVTFFLKPNFALINSKTVLAALGQAFFSLSIGEAVLTVYGSYTDKKVSLPSVALWIAFFDTTIALLAGLMIFPALFSIGHPSTFQGVGMLYDAIPMIFSKLPFSHIWSCFFFLILFIAALTTCFALFEIPVVFLMEEKSFSRNNASLLILFLVSIISMPIGLSKGAIYSLTEFKIPFIPAKGVYDIMDYLWGSLGCSTTALIMTLYVKNKWGTTAAMQEAIIGANPFFIKFGQKIWAFLIKYFIPYALILILLSLFWNN